MDLLDKAIEVDLTTLQITNHKSHDTSTSGFDDAEEP